MPDLQRVTRRECCGTLYEQEHLESCRHAPPPYELIALQAEIPSLEGPTVSIPIHPKPNPRQELADWWINTAKGEAAAVVPKAIEYGATDLQEIGRAMQLAGVNPGSNADELGIYFYIVGKMARWTDAIQNGRAVSDDTLYDIGVYIRMAQRVRTAGGWPGVNLEEA